MKVAIVTAVYAPMSTPRAFRATELAKEFARRGDDVTVYNCTSIINQPPRNVKNVKYVDLGIRLIGNSNLQSRIRNNKISIKFFNLLKSVAFYWTLSTWMIYLRGLLFKFNTEENYDLLISIGLPFTIHWGVSTKIKGNNLAKCYVADYGDPFSRHNSNIKVAKYFQYIEKRVINKFDYIAIPTEKAISTYEWLKSVEKIKVIPQGFCFEEVKLHNYVPNKIPTFAYAGIFYPDIRNPQKLFEILLSLKIDFRFYIYTAESNTDSYGCILPYIKRFGEKMIVKNAIPRLDLIKELSKMDFIINMNNKSSNQVPSKLIDYALSKRPIFSCNPSDIDIEKLNRFCIGDFDGSEIVDLEKYNIKKIVDDFSSLVP